MKKPVVCHTSEQQGFNDLFFEPAGLPLNRYINKKKNKELGELIIHNVRIYHFKDWKKLVKYSQRDPKKFQLSPITEIWSGDLDINRDYLKLYDIYQKILEPLIVTTQFGTEITRFP